MARRERPLKRTNPSGKEVWVARWTDKTGKRRYGWPPDIPGTHKLKRDAQDAIDACHERDQQGPARSGTVGAYAAEWQKLHPRARVTDRTNRYRLNAVLDVELEGVALREWPFERLRRRHANLLVAYLFEAGRAHTGVVNVLAVLSALTEDAIDDEVAVANPFKGVKVRANDPRIRKSRTPVRVFSWQEMHEFARACARADSGPRKLREWRAVYAEAMVRMLSDCGLRAGELLALRRSDLDLREGAVRVERTVALGEVLAGTKTDHSKEGAGRTVPVPSELVGMLRALPPRIDTPLLFPNPRGDVWNYQSWWAQVWVPGRKVSGMDVRPHELRHSYVSRLRAAGVDPADLADVSGHNVDTATRHYTHALRRSFEEIRRAVGE